MDPKLEKRSRFGRSGESTDIRAIIISPTRELAEQIAVEAMKVTRETGVIVQTAVGGTAKTLGLRKIKSEGCHILVGTPGRLNDLLSDPHSQIRAPNLSCLVLDEADRLLDQGFAPEIRSIQGLLPSRSDVDRQTLLYSATVPREVMQVVRQTMKPDFQFVRTVQEGEQQTHEKVHQKLVTVAGFENQLPALVELCKREITSAASTTGEPAKPFKAIVYFSATADTSLAAAALNSLKEPGQSVFHQHPLRPAKIIEIHAKLTQQMRTRAAEYFRKAVSGILLSSDVTARGMDFPNVTHVIQIGLPPNEEQYVHRLGRTARGDKTGEGWIILTKFETQKLHIKLPNMPLQPDHSLETAEVDMTKDAQLPEHTAKILSQVGDAMKLVPRQLKVASYMAGLGIFSWYDNKKTLIEALNNRTKYGWGMEAPPMIGRRLAMKLRIDRVPGVNVGQEEFAGNTRDEGTGSHLFSGGGSGSFGSNRGGGRGRAGYGSAREDRGRPSYGDRGGSEGGRGMGGYEGLRGGDYGNGDRGGGYVGYGSRGGGYGGRGGGYGGRGGGYGGRGGGYGGEGREGRSRY